MTARARYASALVVLGWAALVYVIAYRACDLLPGGAR